MVHRKDFLSGEITFPVVEISLISPGEFLDHALIGRSCRCREEHFFSSKFRRNLFIKFDIFIRHDKLLTADATFFGFDDFFSRGDKHETIIFKKSQSPHHRLIAIPSLHLLRKNVIYYAQVWVFRLVNHSVLRFPQKIQKSHCLKRCW